MEQCKAEWHSSGFAVLFCALGKGHEGLHQWHGIWWCGTNEGIVVPGQFENNASPDAPADAKEYEELSNVISLDGITFDPNTYLDEELEILQPRLKAKGFTVLAWKMGDRDAFGPLTRICEVWDPETKKARYFIYG